MAVINLSKPPALPYVYRGLTAGTSNVVQEVTLPTFGGVRMIVNNHDKSTKVLVIAFDQALVDGGAGGPNYLTVDEIVEFALDGNGASGLPSCTKFALFSPSHTNVAFEIVLMAAKPAF